MRKDETIRQALSEALRPDENRGEQVSRLFDRMVGNTESLSLEERCERFRMMLRECRTEGQDLLITLMKEGQPSGINLLSVREALDEAIRLSEWVMSVPDYLKRN